jgi:subfamily B ATP-binding cassette protein MsbA
MNGSFASIMVSLLLFYRALSHLAILQYGWNGFLGSSAGIDSIEALLEDFNNYKEPDNKERIDNIASINLRNVSLAFGSHQVLRNINMDISQKTSIALVGESGAGKTTLANVICGLQPVNHGNILINGKELYSSDINFFRKKVGYITQESVIFNDTIFNNITFWAEKNEENLKKFWNVIEMVSLEKFVKNLEFSEDSPLGHNGILVSGGQKQRISIARELFKDCELLVLDEATSALDSETELHIKENIDLLQGKCTIIIIAHRLSTIKDTDVVYLLNQGEIIEYGSYNELSNTSVRFKKMLDLQNVT